MTVLQDIDHVLERFVSWLYTIGAGTPLRILFSGASLILPFGIVFFDDPSALWLLPYLLVLLAAWILERYHLGSVASRLAERFGIISASFAGGIEELTNRSAGNQFRKMSDGDAMHLCVGFLHRIRDFAAATMGVGEKPRMRATLAVPICDREGRVTALRVWCYDSTYPQRNYSTISLYDEKGYVRQGAPMAYDRGIDGFSIIYDIRSVPGIERADRRPYRSVVSFAVPRLGANGKPLAVVSIDADRPAVFSEAVVLRRIRPHIGPVLAAVGLILALRRNEATYEFPA